MLGGVADLGLYQNFKKFSDRCNVIDDMQRGSRGVEIEIQPDVPDAPDAGYATQGLERHGLRRVRRVMRRFY